MPLYNYCFANCGGGEAAGLTAYVAGSVFEQEGQDPKIPGPPRYPSDEFFLFRVAAINITVAV